jgi:hypothetical protein
MFVGELGQLRLGLSLFSGCRRAIHEEELTYSELIGGQLCFQFSACTHQGVRASVVPDGQVTL